MNINYTSFLKIFKRFNKRSRSWSHSTIDRYFKQGQAYPYPSHNVDTIFIPNFSYDIIRNWEFFDEYVNGKLQ
jgi:hypothetical protein